ncbi:MAG: hypothetical protein CSA38_05220 [Flavobacteriales bacterium]|nr:MAG: hypothetical protein CSA38_05220 [Flavobacteriales bacterium]
MLIASSYKYGSNALFVFQKLQDNGFSAIVKEEPDEAFPFQIWVKKADLKGVMPIIERLTIVENDLDPQSEGCIEGYVEWKGNMYNAGYYTGGRIPYWLYNKKKWKYLVPVYLFCGIFYMISFIFFDLEITFYSLMWMMIYFFIGIAMLFQLYDSKGNK